MEAKRKNNSEFNSDVVRQSLKIEWRSGVSDI